MAPVVNYAEEETRTPPEGDLTVNELCERYEVSRTIVYQRVEAAQAKSYRKGPKVFFQPSEVWKLDQLEQRLRSGTSLRELAKEVKEWAEATPFNDEPAARAVVDINHPPLREVEPNNNVTSLSRKRQEENVQLVAAFTTAVGQALKDTRETVADPLTAQRQLLEAAEKDYLLTTRQLAQVCGVARSTLNKRGKRTVLYGFLLERVTELSWKVRRASDHEVEVAEGKYEKES